MKIKKLTLQNYRNYENLEIFFHPQVNIFLGENAQGKTNLLESLYVLAMTKSHRTNHEKELIGFNQNFASIKGEIEKKHSTFPIEIYFTNKGRKTKVAHLEQKRLSEYIGQMNVILFAPEDLVLVKGSPNIRRKFLDIEISQMNPVYLHDLSNYQRNLKQKNTYIKQMKYEKKEVDVMYLDILDEQLATFGSSVILHRLEFLKKLEVWAAKIHTQISNDKETLKIKYLSSFKITENVTKEEIFQQLKKALYDNRQKDIFRQNSSVGPHRDDIEFMINEKNVAVFGSQGQQRSTALSIKLAEIDLIKEVTGVYPILLLDDVMSELDNARQMHLLEVIEGKTQTFITTTTLKHLEKLTIAKEIFTIQDGHVV